MALPPGGLFGAKTEGRGGDGGTFTRGLVSVRNDSNGCGGCTLSLRNGFSAPPKRARIVLRMEQGSNVMSGPFPTGTHGDTTNAGTRRPYGIVISALNGPVDPGIDRASATGGMTWS